MAAARAAYLEACFQDTAVLLASVLQNSTGKPASAASASTEDTHMPQLLFQSSLRDLPMLQLQSLSPLKVNQTLQSLLTLKISQKLQSLLQSSLKLQLHLPQTSHLHCCHFLISHLHHYHHHHLIQLLSLLDALVATHSKPGLQSKTDSTTSARRRRRCKHASPAPVTEGLGDA
ncbi:hypothetical protein AMECASPLE_026275 [Ameca splendens]|uniref:Uncharacterized protein n=1 Tax=Ameca splendens TaxID=208324 RepID=A0ABV0Z372_9TELE